MLWLSPNNLNLIQLADGGQLVGAASRARPALQPDASALVSWWSSAWRNCPAGAQRQPCAASHLVMAAVTPTGAACPAARRLYPGQLVVIGVAQLPGWRAAPAMRRVTPGGGRRHAHGRGLPCSPTPLPWSAGGHRRGATARPARSASHAPRHTW